jgi:copper resistance protein B
LRLRYEITRKFAPYIGVTWNRQFGETADFTRMRGGDPSEVQAVAGVRLWF